jgi:hypothetical protein
LPLGGDALEAMERDDAAADLVAQGVDEGEAKRRTGGRPKGALNKTTHRWAAYILSRYPSPLVAMADLYARPLGELAAELGCDRLDAARLQLRAAPEAIAAQADQRSVQDTCKMWSQGGIEGQRLRVEGPGEVVHIERILTEAADVLAHVGT